MSGYLHRLIRRSPRKNESPTLQPFVHSTSPIAEHDQRLGMANFEGVGNSISISPHVEPEPDWGREQVAEIPQPITPDIKTSKNVVPRKMSASVAESTPSITPITSKTVSTDLPESNEIPLSRAGVDRSSPSKLTMEVQTQPFTSSVGKSEAFVENYSDRDPVFSTSGVTAESVSSKHDHQPTPTSAIARDTAAESDISQFRVTAATNDLVEAQSPATEPILVSISAIPSRERLETRAVEQHGERSPKILQDDSSKTPVLEPSTRKYAQRETELVEPRILNIDPPVTPQITIGRIEVQVVPQTVTETKPTKSQSGSLTAASVSVIGPLGGKTRSNLWLNLRQR